MQFATDHSRMNHYLISFPASAMNHITAHDFPSVVESSLAVIREAKAAGVYVFGGGIDETIPPVLVTGEGKVSPGSYPETRTFNGGFCVIKVKRGRKPKIGQQRLQQVVGALRNCGSSCMTQSPERCQRRAAMPAPKVSDRGDR